MQARGVHAPPGPPMWMPATRAHAARRSEALIVMNRRNPPSRDGASRTRSGDLVGARSRRHARIAHWWCFASRPAVRSAGRNGRAGACSFPVGLASTKPRSGSATRDDLVSSGSSTWSRLARSETSGRCSCWTSSGQRGHGGAVRATRSSRHEQANVGSAPAWVLCDQTRTPCPRCCALWTHLAGLTWACGTGWSRQSARMFVEASAEG